MTKNVKPLEERIGKMEEVLYSILPILHEHVAHFQKWDNVMAELENQMQEIIQTTYKVEFIEAGSLPEIREKIRILEKRGFQVVDFKHDFVDGFFQNFSAVLQKRGAIKCKVKE